MRVFLVILLVFLAVPSGTGVQAAPAAEGVSKGAAKTSYGAQVKPLLEKYCYNCHGAEKHKGDLDLSIYSSGEATEADRPVWEKVMKNLRSHEMPPENKPQPTEAERALMAGWVEAEYFQMDCTKPDPGRVTIRRLNRVEYNNTIRDLVGVDFKPAEDFPADDSGYGFDNIGDALSVPPVLLEKYLAAAQKILDTAVLTEDPTLLRTNHFAGDTLSLDANSTDTPGGGALLIGREGAAHVDTKILAEGDYKLVVKAYGEQAGPEVVKMAVRHDGKELKKVEVPATKEKPQFFEFDLHLKPGTNRFAVAYLNNYVNQQDPDPKNRDRNLVVNYLELTGPANAAPVVLPESHKRLFPKDKIPGNRRGYGRDIISRFAKKAYRRPVTQLEVDRLMKFYEMAEAEGEKFEGCVKLALQAVLVSPHFLFRGELQPEPDNPKAVHPVNEYALASRLSYFLWSSMPDDELFAHAEKGTLRRNLDAQVYRMLQSAKSRGLVENFGGQWLETRNLRLVTPDAWVFPEFDDDLRAAMQKETEMFFECILREDRSVLEFLDSDYTFVNERLARHYGISSVKGSSFQKVSLKGTGRGGLLTQASFLTITSNPTRTSPVKRGKWILENILGTPPPPPPPNVPELKTDGKQLTGTLRQKMEQHRADPNCASCHARMDPIGFGFEHFNAIGGWREVDGKSEIDPAGKLVSGEVFKDPNDLKAVLLNSKRKEFLHCLSEKMLTFALGRGLEYYDTCAVEEIMRGLEAKQHRFSALIMETIKSAPFQKRRGEAVKMAENR